MIAYRVFHEPLCLGVGNPVFGLTLELGVADENGKERAAGAHHIIGGDVRGFLYTF